MAETVVSRGGDTTDGDLDTSDAYESIREIDTSKKEVRFSTELCLWIALKKKVAAAFYSRM